MAINNENTLKQIDLYSRLMPAFNTKIKEWQREKIFNINQMDLWNYCLQKKWLGKKNLRMYELVDDILNIDIIDYIKFKNQNKKNE